MECKDRRHTVQEVLVSIQYLQGGVVMVLGIIHPDPPDGHPQVIPVLPGLQVLQVPGQGAHTHQDHLPIHQDHHPIHPDRLPDHPQDHLPAIHLPAEDRSTQVNVFQSDHSKPGMQVLFYEKTDKK